MPKVTIKDIAERAGVSKTSVSFAFNNPEHLSEDTVERILEIANEMGYAPNPVARSMNTGKTGTIGLLVPQPIPQIIRNPFIPEFIEGIGEVITKEKFSLMLVPPLEGSMRRAVNSAAVDGFLTLGLEESKGTMVVLRQRGIPFVTVDSDPIEGVSSVNIDDENGAKAIMRAVLAAGHRNIVILAIRSGKYGQYKEYAGTLRLRMNGYLSALEEVGLSLSSRKVRLIECVSTQKGGYNIFNRIWNVKNRPTAIVAMSDIIAIGAMKAAQDAGLNIPEDLSIVGFDDIPLASLVTPALTTVSQPLCEKGRLAAGLLMKTIDGQEEVVSHVLPTKVIQRASMRHLSEKKG
jgi:alanine racemase